MTEDSDAELLEAAQKAAVRRKVFRPCEERIFKDAFIEGAVWMEGRKSEPKVDVIPR